MTNRGFAVNKSQLGIALLLRGVAIILALLVIFQCARLVWTLVAPIGPLGDWRPSALSGRSLPVAKLASFDPFFRLQPAEAQAVVTSLPVKLFGVRVDMASGRGSAIIATPDGVQSSYAVGDAVMPGVILKQVAFDYVALERAGVVEKIFLDQSIAAPVAGRGTGMVTAAPSTSMSPLQDLVAMTPRMDGARVTGLTLTPKGDGSAFTAAGLQAGDILVAVNGTPVIDDNALARLPASGPVSLDVERGGRRVSVSAKLNP